MERNKKSFLALSLILLMFLSLSLVVAGPPDPNSVPPTAIEAPSGSTTILGPNGEHLVTLVSGGKEPVGINKPITEPEWMLQTMQFFRWGSTPADLVVSIAIILMVLAFMYDALSFTAIETGWARWLVAIGVAAIASVVGLSNWIAGLIILLVGGSTILGTLVIVFIAIIGMVAGSWLKRREMHAEMGEAAVIAEDSYAVATQASVGHLKEALAMKKAAEKNLKKT